MENHSSDIGVIVGRFQVHTLHEAHRHLVESVMQAHKRAVIFLGVTAVPVTKNNPLDFVTRKELLLQAFPSLTVLSIPDMYSNKDWSRELDQRIREACPVGSVLLYGGRDSFIKSYQGHFQTKELEQEIYVSGTEVRREASREVKSSPDFRAGVIFAAYNQYSKVYPTVDVAILHDNKLLLGKKPHQEKYRFIGGFADPGDDSFEAAAKREAMEETNLETDHLEYIGTAKIDDWRYRNEEDKIITTFYSAQYIFGNIQPKDDISELRWFPIDELSKEQLVEEHGILFDMLMKKLNKK